ncbi:neuroendocrine protein 7B2 isoform X2 [Diabrotica undecimpunctata]|uniref:neuroendocrine protein 7B2 isoform X2 n=1 Tax=Diabrotica undecimpunctata TaxID=50387 RepID=UPI003B63C7AD
MSYYQCPNPCSLISRAWSRIIQCAFPPLIPARHNLKISHFRISARPLGSKTVQLKMKITILMCCLTGAMCYLPPAKENLLSGLFLRDLVNRINGKGISEGDGVSYLDFTDGMPLDGRSLSGTLEEEQMFPMDYEAMGEMNMHPSIRDQEYLQHSTLWGKQYLNGDRDENSILHHNGFKNKNVHKGESTLPAYCSPPNPCPIGYTAEHGCIEMFENTASFSRRYQASQNCMCDTEHMFECPTSNDIPDDNSIDMFDGYHFNKMLQQSAKSKNNPFLTGEKLPVAAKKGNNVIL